MPWDERAFAQLRDEVAASLGGAHPTTGVPFYAYVYPPAQECHAVEAFEQLANVLRGQGRQVQVIYVGRLLASVLRSTPLVLSAAGKMVEQQSRQALQDQLAQPEALPRQIPEALLNGVDGVSESLKGGSQDRCAILVRTGALYPFVHVSQILNHLEQKTRWTVVVAFPGTCAPGSREALRFLDETEGAYYRARVIHSR